MKLLRQRSCVPPFSPSTPDISNSGSEVSVSVCKLTTEPTSDYERLHGFLYGFDSNALASLSATNSSLTASHFKVRTKRVAMLPM